LTRMTGEKKIGEIDEIETECDNFYDPCCDPKYQSLCEDDYYDEIYEECETNDKGELECKCYYDDCGEE